MLVTLVLLPDSRIRSQITVSFIVSETDGPYKSFYSNPHDTTAGLLQYIRAKHSHCRPSTNPAVVLPWTGFIVWQFPTVCKAMAVSSSEWMSRCLNIIGWTSWQCGLCKWGESEWAVSFELTIEKHINDIIAKLKSMCLCWLPKKSYSTPNMCMLLTCFPI